MPVIVEPDDWPIWLGEVEGDLAALLLPSPPGELRVWPVSREVSRRANNGPRLMEPIEAGT